MTREANVWLNGSEVNTQQMEDFFFPFFSPLPGDLVFSSCWIYEAGGTQGHFSHHALQGGPSPTSRRWSSGCLRLCPQPPQGLTPEQGQPGLAELGKQNCLRCEVARWDTGQETNQVPHHLGNAVFLV